MTRNRAGSIMLGSAVVLLAMGSGIPPAAAADTYDVDPVHSYVLFRVNHLGVGTSYGRFNDVSGTLVVDEENPAQSSVSIEIAAESVDTANADRDKHLKSPDFFSVQQFPRITFKSTGIEKTGDAAYDVSGELTLHGVTKPVTLSLRRVGSGKDPWGKFRTGFDGSFVVKRGEFGISYMPQGLGGDVEIFVAVEAIKQ